MRAGTFHRGEQQVLACVWHADRWHLRLRGLLFRAQLQPGQGLLITPCASVHTMGMGYPLDLLFLDRHGRALGWHEAVAPWRSASCKGARSTLEMPIGSLARIVPEVGQMFCWRAPTGLVDVSLPSKEFQA